MRDSSLRDLGFSIRNARPMRSGTAPPSTETLYPSRLAALEERLAVHKARPDDSATPTARLRAGWYGAHTGAQGPRRDYRDVKREYRFWVDCLGHPTLSMYLVDFNMHDPRAFAQLAKGVQGLEDAVFVKVPENRRRGHRRVVLYDARRTAGNAPFFAESHCDENDADNWSYIEAEVEMAEVKNTAAKNALKVVSGIPAQPAASIVEEQEETPSNPKHALRCKIHSPIPGVPDAAQRHICVGLELFIESMAPFLQALPASCAPLLPGPLQFCMRLEKITLKEGETLPSTEWRPVHGRVTAVVHHVITRSLPMAGGDIDLAGGTIPVETTSGESQCSAGKSAKESFPSPSVRGMYSGCGGVCFVPGARVPKRFRGEYTVVCAGGPNGAVMRNRKMWVKPGLERGDATMTVLMLCVIDQRAPLSHCALSRPGANEIMDAMEENVSDDEDDPVDDERVGETLLLTNPNSFNAVNGTWFAPFRAQGASPAVLASWLNKCPPMLRVKAWRLATLGIGPFFFEPGSDLELHVIKYGGSHTFVVVRKPDTAMPLHGGRAKELLKAHGVRTWREFETDKLWASTTGLIHPTLTL